MNGIFYKRKQAFVLFDKIGIIAGILLILLFGYFLIFEPSPILEDNYLCVFFVFMGITSIFINIYTLLYNKNAHLSINENHLSAKYGLNKHLECEISDIKTVSYGITNMSMNLIIVLNNGEKHNLLYLNNAADVHTYIRERMEFNKLTNNEQTLLDLQNEKASRKKLIIIVVTLIIFMFAMIFVTIFITEGKDFSDFNNFDHIVFNIMVVAELINFCFLMFFSIKAGNKLRNIQIKSTDLKSNIIHNHPLLSGNKVAVYTDISYDIRVTIFEFPNSTNVYYCIEKLDVNYELQKVFTSDIFENLDELIEELEELFEHLIKLNTL